MVIGHSPADLLGLAGLASRLLLPSIGSFLAELLFFFCVALTIPRVSYRPFLCRGAAVSLETARSP